MKDYICKIATIDEMETKWNYEIKKNKSPNWKTWKAEAIDRVKNGQSIAYYGILNGKIICEATAMLDKSIVQNSDGLVDEKTVYLCAFRTIEKYQNKGYFSKLFKFMINDLKSKGYQNVTLGVEPTETENLNIYKHLGFNELIKSAQETYPNGTVIDVDYYSKIICSEFDNIKEVVNNTFTDELKSQTIDLIDFFQNNSMTARRISGYWEDQFYWQFNCCNECVCYVLLNGHGDEEQFAPFTLWTDDSGSCWYENLTISDEMKKCIWDNVDYCVNCGSCSGGKEKIILGKKFCNICKTVIKFTNPDCIGFETIKKLAIARKTDIMR